MKKLKLNLANMPNAQVITREQLKKVIGGQYGSDRCRIYSNGEQIDELYSEGAGNTSCENQSATTREKADYYASNGYSNVTYDCSCDGWGH